MSCLEPFVFELSSDRLAQLTDNFLPSEQIFTRKDDFGAFKVH